jgi:serine/threonine-protein kinase
VNQALTLPSIGDVVDGKFRIDRKLGEGGTSTVYEVRHVITDKKFAIKWLAPELSNNELAIERFIHEARVCGRFAHPHAVQIYDICRSNASCYLLMELLEGESLESRLQRVKRFTVQAACDIVLPCIEAVGAAHRVGIVHRDLKPSNIFLCSVEGRAGEVPKVLDFGISKLSFNGYDLSPVTTNTRTVIGTPLYMAPEQMRGQAAEPRFDIYALGIVLYELIAGRAPFECDTFADLVFKVLEAQPRRLELVADVAPEFGAIVARAIAGEAEDRFATMAELAQALLPYSSQGEHTAIAPPEVRASAARTPIYRTRLPTTPLVRKLALVETHAPADAAAAALEAEDVACVEPSGLRARGSPEQLSPPGPNGAGVSAPVSRAHVAPVKVMLAPAAKAELASRIALSLNGTRMQTTTPIARVARKPTSASRSTVASPISTQPLVSPVDASERAEPLTRIPRTGSARRLAVAISLAAATILTWHTLARAPRTSVAKTEPAMLRPRTLEPAPEADALRSTPVVPDTRSEASAEPVSVKPKPRPTPVASSKSAGPASANFARRTSRTRHPRPSPEEQATERAPERGSASEPASASKRSALPADSSLRIQRSDFDEPARGLSLPAAELSRQDF